MRLVVYLGTRSCRTALADALDGYHDELVLLVPADTDLLGSRLTDAELDAGLAEVARIVRDRALARAAEIARTEARELADVFGQDPPPPEDRIAADILEGDLVAALEGYVAGLDAETAYIGRDALDVLDGAGIRPSEALDPHGVELVTR